MCTSTCCPTWNESIIIFCFGLQVSCERLQAGSSSLITSSRGRGWTTCVAASSTDASGSRRLVRGAYLAVTNPPSELRERQMMTWNFMICQTNSQQLFHLYVSFVSLDSQPCLAEFNTNWTFFPQFRLKRCGLRRPVYLVEECGTAASHLSLPETTLQQAIVNTQVRVHTLLHSHVSSLDP